MKLICFSTQTAIEELPKKENKKHESLVAIQKYWVELFNGIHV